MISYQDEACSVFNSLFAVNSCSYYGFYPHFNNIYVVSCFMRPFKKAMLHWFRNDTICYRWALILLGGNQTEVLEYF